MPPEPHSGPAPRGQRCHLTLLFADLCDSTALAAELEAELYAELLGQLRAGYERLIEAAGGTLVRVQGDGLLAVFGYPQVREDDGRRATETALALHALVRQTVCPGAPGRALRLHSGIHAGLVLVQQGDLVLGRLELLGQPPSIAARLCEAAARDEILVSEDSLGRAGRHFDTSARRLLSLKGLAEPLPALAVYGRAAAHGQAVPAGAAGRGRAPLIGREAVLARLRAALAEAGSGAGRDLAIVASAGLGKTRLAEELLREAGAAGWTVLRGQCEDSLGAEPLRPFLQMLRGWAGLSPQMSADQASAALLGHLGLEAPALLDRATPLLRLLHPREEAGAAGGAAALQALLEALQARAPLLLFVDDWHWADDASRQLLQALRGAAGAGRGRLLLLATRAFEPGDAGTRAFEQLALEPLGEQAAADTIAALLPRADPFVSAEIRRHAGGNPLYLEELCHSAAHGEIDRRLVRTHGGSAWLSILIESRLARLPPAQAELLRLAAVIGGQVPRWLLHQLAPAADGAQERALAEQDFLFPAEEPELLRFKHGITREVVYAAVGLHQRRQWHGRIAAALRQHWAATGQAEASETLAYHYGASGQAAEAAHYAELAGDKAVASSALDLARSQYRAALAALDSQPTGTPSWYQRWASIAQKLALVCVFDASRRDLPLFERAQALARESDDAQAQARARYWLAYISYALGDMPAAIAHGERAEQAAAVLADGALRVQIRATLGQALTAAADYAAALPLLDEAIAIKRQHRSGSRGRPAVGLAYSLVCRAWVLGDRGDFAQAHDCLAEADTAVLGLTHEIAASISGWRSALLLWQGRWPEAAAAGQASARVAEQTRSLFQFCMGRAMQAYADWRQDGAAEHEARLRDATDWLAPREGSLFRSLNHGWLADMAAARGDLGESRRQLALALRCGRRSRDWLGGPMACRALAGLLLAQGDTAGAARYLAQAERQAALRDAAHEQAHNRLALAGLAARLGRPDPAGLAQALDEYRRLDMPWFAARAEAQAAE